MPLKILVSLFFAVSVSGVPSILPVLQPTHPSSESKAGGQCCSMAGTWYNQHGSEMVLDESAPGFFGGTYYSPVALNATAMLSRNEARRQGPLVGSSLSNGVFAFHVVWHNSTTVTGWTGQCHQCGGGEESLLTTWILTDWQPTCDDAWKANRIGQDVFRRTRMANPQ